MLSNTSKLKIELIRRGLTQAALARQLGISKQYMCDILQGRRKPQPIIDRLIADLDFPAILFGRKKAA